MTMEEGRPQPGGQAARRSLNLAAQPTGDVFPPFILFYFYLFILFSPFNS